LKVLACFLIVRPRSPLFGIGPVAPPLLTEEPFCRKSSTSDRNRSSRTEHELHSSRCFCGSSEVSSPAATASKSAPSEQARLEGMAQVLVKFLTDGPARFMTRQALM
jgi:hypothetical protein